MAQLALPDKEEKQIILEKEGEKLDLQVYKSRETGNLRLSEGDYIITASPANNELHQPALN